MYRDLLSPDGLLAAGMDPKLPPAVREWLSKTATDFAGIVTLIDPASKAAVLKRFAEPVDREPTPVPYTREELDQILGPIDEEAVRSGLEEIERTGGHQLKDFLPELERLAAGHD